MKKLLKKRKNNEAVLVAEGDSWFSFFDFEKSVFERVKSYFLDRCGTNILEVMEKKHNYHVWEVAKSGDRLEQMASPKQLSELIQYLIDLARKDIIPKAILFSGGGNDVVDKLPKILNQRNENQVVLREEKINEVIDGCLKLTYKRLIGCVTAINEYLFDKKIPILIHGYGYSVPDGRGVNKDGRSRWCKILFSILRIQGKIGPWLKRAFECKGYKDLQANTKTMMTVINRFNCMLSQLPNEPDFDHVYYVDVRECLTNSLKKDAYKQDWGDEMHPTEDGFKKVAKKFDKVIKNL